MRRSYVSAMRPAALALLLAAALAQPAAAQSGLVFPAAPTADSDDPARLPAAAPDPKDVVGTEYPSDAADVTAFVAPDRWIIRDYFVRRQKDRLLSKEDRRRSTRALPVGLSTQPRAGDILPAFERNPLPQPLLRDLPRLPPGVERVVIGHDVILLRIRSGEVIDVLADILR